MFTRVVLALSSFRNDEAILETLREVATWGRTFAAVVVVDSLGNPDMQQRLQHCGLRVDYHSADTNLGSAGNLAQRLHLAAKYDADWMLALNHDGRATPELLSSMLEAGAKLHNPGAVYPLRQLPNFRGCYDLTGTLPVPVIARRVSRPPEAESVPVCWSSSNGALYHLAPIRAGHTPPASFWMGYEDLAYGWTLRRERYDQVVCPKAVFQDTYEFRQSASGHGPRLTSKPSWYAYYNARNLWRAAKETQQPAWVRAAVLARLCAEVGVTATLRPRKAERLNYVFRGILDGVRGRGGKWDVP